MTCIAPVLGLLAGVAGIADTIPYVRDTVGGSTRPHRGTWLIWSVLAIVVCLSQRADGASWSLIMAAAQAVLTSAVFLLSIRRGEGGLSPADVLMIGAARLSVRERELVTLVAQGRTDAQIAEQLYISALPSARIWTGSEAGARWLAERGARLVGIDSVNIDDIQGGGRRPAHSILLRAGIPVVEHLTGLGQLPPTGSWFTAAPIPLAGFGSFPTRAYGTIPRP
jgi:hypothetical protein